MARRATVIKEARDSREPLLVLDAGNSLLPTEDGASWSEPAPLTRGRTSVEALNRMAYDAVALGANDALIGREDLGNRIAEAKGVTFVSANLFDKATGRLLVQPYIIKQVGGHRVALLGISGELPQGVGDLGAKDALETAREYVPQLRSQADSIMLLSNAGADTNRAIAEAVPGVDLVISGGSPSGRGETPIGQSTLVVQADSSAPGDAGRYLGRLEVEFDRSGALGKHTWTSIELGPTIMNDPDMAAWVETLSE